MPGVPGGRTIPSRDVRSLPQSSSAFGPASATAQPTTPSNRVLLKPAEVNLTTNFVIGKVEAQGDLPDRIAVMVKVLKDAKPGEVDFSADHPKGTNAADMAGFGIKWSQQQRARHADEDVDWSQAKWMPFTNSVAIDLGPGEGQRLVWLMGMWTKTNGYSRSGSGTHVRVGHTPSGIPNQSHQAPRITIQWPRDGQQLSRKDLVMASGFVDDPDAHVTCVTATAEGTNRVDASVARNGFFSFRDVRLQSGTNRLTFIATNDGGKASETNLVVYQKP